MLDTIVPPKTVIFYTNDHEGCSKYFPEIHNDRDISINFRVVFWNLLERVGWAETTRGLCRDSCMCNNTGLPTLRQQNNTKTLFYNLNRHISNFVQSSRCSWIETSYYFLPKIVFLMNPLTIDWFNSFLERQIYSLDFFYGVISRRKFSRIRQKR